MSIVPASRPQWPRERIEAILAAHGVTARPALVGVRGYYLDTMGRAGVNDRGLYDDAMFLVSDGLFRAYNANTDPSRGRPGIATLEPGVHLYRKGKHGVSRDNPYPALRPATPGERLPVRRDGSTGLSSGVAINIHRGGRTTTSSEGCQTIPPDQWPEFIGAVYAAMDAAHAKTIPYLLVEHTAGANAPDANASAAAIASDAANASAAASGDPGPA